MHPEVEHLIEAWHWMYFEADLLFEGLRQENLHRRPAPNLLAISEHVAHVVRSEASIVERYLFSRDESEWADTLMRRKLFGWPPTMLEADIDQELAMLSVDQVHEQLLWEHKRCYETALGLRLPASHTFADGWDRCTSVRDRLRIAAYHVGYHAGQIYTVRHLLGEETPEN